MNGITTYTAASPEMNPVLLLKTSWNIYKNSFATILKITAVMLAPVFIFSFFLSKDSIIDLDNYIFGTNSLFSSPTLSYISAVKRIIAVFAGLFISGYFIIASVYITTQFLNEAKASFSGFIRFLLRKILKYFALAVILSILFIPGFYVYFITSALAWIILGFSLPAAIALNQTITEALKSSWRIFFASPFSTIGYWAFAIIISMILNVNFYVSHYFNSVHLAMALTGVTIILQFFPLILIIIAFFRLNNAIVSSNLN